MVARSFSDPISGFVVGVLSMDPPSLSICSLPENVLRPLLHASNSSILGKALEILIEVSKTSDGRSDLASKSILPVVLQLCKCLSYPFRSHLLLFSLKLLRNLCVDERRNQNFFVECNGVGTVLAILNSAGSNSDYGVIRMGLQVLANVSSAGVQHQLSIWNHLFPLKFVEFASMRRSEIWDPLCQILCLCSKGNNRLLGELCGVEGLPVMAEIIRTGVAVGFGKDWLEILFSKICFEENQFPQLFSRLYLVAATENGGDVNSKDYDLVSEQAFLLNILSEILNERISKTSLPSDFALCVLEKLKQVGVIDFAAPGNSFLPTGSSVTIAVDVLEFSLSILRNVCAQDRLGVASHEDCSVDVVVVDSLLSSGLLDLLLYLLGQLEPPAIIRKAVEKSKDDRSNSSSKLSCPYKGYRSDIVAVIGNCTYERKHVQDEIRQRGAILLLLQQCVTDDEENPFLREWGIWTVRNLLDRNPENQRMVAELELQASVDIPEIVALGVRVVIDPKTRRPKLVNVL